MRQVLEHLPRCREHEDGQSPELVYMRIVAPMGEFGAVNQRQGLTRWHARTLRGAIGAPDIAKILNREPEHVLTGKQATSSP